MQAAFEANPDAPFLDPGLLRWKYFEAHPSGGSYLMVQNGRIVAHGCAWPVSLKGAVCLIDWVSAKGVPGVGIMLARKICGLSSITLSIGGSAMTQQIMPKIGFEKKGELHSYARVLQPWRQFQMRPGRLSARAVVRLGRNWAWSWAPSALTRGWEAEVSEMQNEPILHCPGAEMHAYRLTYLGRAAGSALVSRVGGQSRIVRIRPEFQNEPNWESAYAAVLEAVCSSTDSCEIIALAHDGRSRRALEANGFRERARRSVFVSDPLKLLSPKDYPLPLDMLDDDLFYLNTPDYPYWT